MVDDIAQLASGNGELPSRVEAELAGLVPDGFAGSRVLHLQSRTGEETLVFAQRGAEVVGIDLSRPAVLRSRALATELGLADRARFVIADLVDGRHSLPQPDSFDLVYSVWGARAAQHDLDAWARLVEWYLKPGGSVYLGYGHPLDDVAAALGAAGLAISFLHNPEASGRATLGATKPAR